MFRSYSLTNFLIDNWKSLQPRYKNRQEGNLKLKISNAYTVVLIKETVCVKVKVYT